MNEYLSCKVLSDLLKINYQLKVLQCTCTFTKRDVVETKQKRKWIISYLYTIFDHVTTSMTELPCHWRNCRMWYPNRDTNTLYIVTGTEHIPDL